MNPHVDMFLQEMLEKQVNYIVEQNFVMENYIRQLEQDLEEKSERKPCKCTECGCGKKEK